MNKSLYGLGLVVVAGTFAAGCCTYHHKEANVSWTDVPTVVQSTIQAHEYGGTVASKIEKETTKNGIVYEAKVKGTDGKYSEVKVAEDGKLLKYKTCKD
jgi:hypothetical protein